MGSWHLSEEGTVTQRVNVHSRAAQEINKMRADEQKSVRAEAALTDLGAGVIRQKTYLSHAPRS